jgi:sulfatase maturation enzyme AslB (radical SAM superfamily)
MFGLCLSWCSTTKYGVSFSDSVKDIIILTVLPSKFVETWKNFKNVTVKVSIDAVGIDYEYVRYPGKWSVIDRNIKRLEEVCAEIPKLGVEFHTVFSSYNAHAIPNLIRYLNSIKSNHFLNFPNTLQVTSPGYADARCIPVAVKQQIANELEELLDQFADETNQRVLNNISNLRSNIKYMLSSDLDQRTFIKFNKKQDQYRTVKTENVINWYNQKI